MVLLCRELTNAKRFYSIENPRSSYLWGFGPVQQLDDVGISVDFDQCEYGLVVPGSPEIRIKKLTRIQTNMRQLGNLQQDCTSGHAHRHCMVRVKVDSRSQSLSQIAGIYPEALCSAWAEAVGRCLSEEVAWSRRRRQPAVPPAQAA